MTATYTAPRPMRCNRCQGRIRAGEPYTYAIVSRAGASAAVHVECPEGVGK